MDEETERDLAIIGLRKMPKNLGELTAAFNRAQLAERPYWSQTNRLPTALSRAYQRLQGKFGNTAKRERFMPSRINWRNL